MADIDGEDPARAAREQNLREAAGRGSDVKCHTANRIKAKMVQPRDKLERRARDVQTGRVVHVKLHSLGYQRAWLAHHNTRYGNGRPFHCITGPRAALEEAAPHQQFVKPQVRPGFQFRHGVFLGQCFAGTQAFR